MTDQNKTDRLNRVRQEAEARDDLITSFQNDLATRDRDLREAIVQARDAGATVEEIAEVLGKSRPWVYAYMKDGD